MNESRKLAELLVGLKYSDLGNAVIEKAKDLILDQLGVELAASTKPWSVAVYRYVRDQAGRGESTIVNYGDRVTAENAAFVNATSGHGFELDDAYLLGNIHPGCVVIPTALAVGERELVDGKTFLLAVIAGYEAMGRIGRSIAPACAERGFHPTSAMGTFGAAVATGKLLGFDETTMLNALGIAGSHSSGSSEFNQTGGTVKRIHAGIAASGGIRAAMLARAGLTGPPTILEGKKGICQALGNCFKAEAIGGPSDCAVLPRTAIKRYCSCFQIQAPIEATSNMVKEHGIKPGDIEEIVMGSTGHALEVVGIVSQPEDITGAQFSARFGIAMNVVKGSNDFKDYNEENLTDPQIRQLVKRVRLEVDPEIEASFPAKRAIRMTIKLKNGSVYEQKLEGARGTPENPMSHDEVKEKFRSLATVVLPDQQVNKLIAVVESLESLGNLSTLSKSLVA
ncbi:MAG: MmgE/PrpD family protein [Chloroflexi bacterium]|nr:MmgE/PrpD family protein [Chloroflexota bacterium]